MTHAAQGSAGAATGTVRSYVAGFILAVALTLFAFGLVMSRALPLPATLGCIFAAATLQILVHLRYFLHLDASSAQRWNLAAILMTALIILIVVGGSVWIMISLHRRTMLQGMPPVGGLSTESSHAIPSSLDAPRIFFAVRRDDGFQARTSRTGS